MTSWLRLMMAELPLLRDLPDLGGRPLPRVTAELGPALPGWVLRLASVLATAALVAVATQRTSMVAGLTWTLIGGAAVVTAILPAAAVAHVVVVLSGLLVAFGGHGPFDPVVFGLIPLAHAVVRLGWWAERVTPTGRVEFRALTRGLRRDLLPVAATLGFGGLVYLVTGHPNPVAVIVGGTALVGLTWLVWIRKPAE